MTENINENNGGQNPTPAPSSLETAPKEAETSSSPNSGIAKKIKWLKRNHKVAQLIINFLLMVGTFLLFWKASQQSDIAKEAITQSKQQFETARENKLAVSSVAGFHNWEKVGGIPKITIWIHNISNHTITIDSEYLGFRFDTTDARLFFKKSDSIIHKVLKQDIPKEGSAQIKYDSKDTVTSSRLDSLKKNLNAIFGVVYFTNDVTHDKMYYFFSMSINVNDKDEKVREPKRLEIYKSENRTDNPYF
jgi:hypothetical protein